MSELSFTLTESKLESIRMPLQPPPDLNHDHQEFLQREREMNMAHQQQLQQDLLQAYSKIQDLEAMNTQQRNQEEKKIYLLRQDFQLEVKKIQAENNNYIEDLKAEQAQKVAELKQKIKDNRIKYEKDAEFLKITASDYRKSLQGNEIQVEKIIQEKSQIVEQLSKELTQTIQKLEQENQEIKLKYDNLVEENKKLIQDASDNKNLMAKSDQENKELKQQLKMLEEEKQQINMKCFNLFSENEILRQDCLKLSENVQLNEKKEQIACKFKQNSSHINDQKQQVTYQTNVIIGYNESQNKEITQNQFFTQPNQTQTTIKSISQSKQQQLNINNGRKEPIQQIAPIKNQRYLMKKVQGVKSSIPKLFSHALMVNQSQDNDLRKFIQTSQSNSCRNLKSASQGNKFIK